MENQHRAIKGYRELDEFEIACMNGIKELAAQVGAFVANIEQLQTSDPRWAAIAKTDLQKGFMALTRAVAQPTTF